MYVIVYVLTLDEIEAVYVIMPQVKKEWADKIVFVDGDSKDGTVEKAKELGFEVIHQKNKGEGNACRVGTDATDSDFVMFFSLPYELPHCQKNRQDKLDSSRGPLMLLCA